ncbi:MAG: hypothetical protein ABH851_02355 [Methanobacteriota archaeon]
MKSINKKLALSALVCLVLLSITCTAQLSVQIYNAFAVIICAIAEALWLIAPQLVTVIIILAAAVWVYSRDDAGLRNQARTWIIHAIIGSIILVVAYSIVTAINIDGSQVVGWCPGVSV